MQVSECYCETPEGLLLSADGLNPMKRWDGSASVIYPVGVTAPATGPSLSADSPSGVITGASNTTPIVITDVAHGLATLDKVTVAGVLGNTAANGDFTVTVLTADTFSLDGSVGDGAYTSGGTWTGQITGTYFAFVRFVNERGSVSDLSPVSVSLTATGAQTITFSGVPIAAQANVTRRQLLRNTDGQTDTFYVDIDTTDLGSASFDSVRVDSDLSTQEAVPLFDDQGEILANLHGVPPSHKSVIAHHSGRMFAAVDRYYSVGGARLANASATVRGVNTAWTAAMDGRELWVIGSTARYTIDGVDVPNQTLTLTEAYAGATDDFAQYTIRPAPAERRLVYYTEAGEPESWPAINAVSIQEDGDEISGLMVMGSFIYILCKRHTYRYTFQSDPDTDGFVYLEGNRGSVNNRCWAIADGDAYMLDHQGIHAFGGSKQGESVSDAVIPVFQGGASGYDGPRINWSAEENFHAVHSPDDRIIRWFVCFSGEIYPRHALAYDYRGQRFWIEEYDRPIASSVTATFNGRSRVYLSACGQTFLLDQGTLDDLDTTAGLTRATATGGDTWGVSDAVNYPFWPASASLVGRSISIVEGRGSGQRRIITASTAGRIRVKDRWKVKPDSTSVYQLGGVGWKWQSGWLRYVKQEDQEPRKVEVIFKVTQADHSLVMRLYEDFKTDAVVMRVTRKSSEAEGFAARKDSPDLVGNMASEYGQAQQRMDGKKELNLIGKRFLSIELAGVTGPERQAIYQVAVDGVDG